MIDRRFFLRGLATLGCSAAAHPFLTTVTLAGEGGLGDHRLVVVILRGAMDGLDAVRPVGDPAFAGYRPATFAPDGAADLDGFFALHPGLMGLMPLWRAGEVGFVHATSTPYRDKRSHFDGQDMLEAGTGMDVAPGAVRDGWLNRMLQARPGLAAETAYAIGGEALPLLAGEFPARNWLPDTRLVLSAQSRLLLDHVYHDDPLFQAAAQEALDLTDGLAAAAADAAMAAQADAGGGMAEDAAMADTGAMAGAGAAPARAALADIDALVDFAATRLRDDTRIAAFSLSGWDTHRGQLYALRRPMSRLERVILRMKDQLGPEVWGRTTLLAMTEFGRTARENGSRGTDHGTGGLMVMAGGAVRGGRVMGRWPGLAEADLYDRRDLMPTSDVRAWAGWAMRGMYGFDAALIERAIFPGLQLGDDPGLLL